MVPAPTEWPDALSDSDAQMRSATCHWRRRAVRKTSPHLVAPCQDEERFEGRSATAKE